MDIQKERQEFELLPDIRGIIQDGFQFNSELNQYFHLDHVNHRLSYAFLMGAWQAWLAAQAQAVPEGFVLVPRELSENHVRSFWENKSVGVYFKDPNEINGFYKAMIEAAEKEMIAAQEQGHD